MLYIIIPNSEVMVVGGVTVGPVDDITGVVSVMIESVPEQTHQQIDHH